MKQNKITMKQNAILLIALLFISTTFVSCFEGGGNSFSSAALGTIRIDPATGIKKMQLDNTYYSLTNADFDKFRIGERFLVGYFIDLDAQTPQANQTYTYAASISHIDSLLTSEIPALPTPLEKADTIPFLYNGEGQIYFTYSKNNPARLTLAAKVPSDIKMNNPCLTLYQMPKQSDTLLLKLVYRKPASSAEQFKYFDQFRSFEIGHLNLSGGTEKDGKVIGIQYTANRTYRSNNSNEAYKKDTIVYVNYKEPKW